MIWPPVKAWTSKLCINGKRHFVAINYGGKLLDRWVILISVLDSNLVFRVSWSELVDTNIWKCGWDENSYSNLSKSDVKKSYLKSSYCINPSIDSGLTLPITKNNIRPWFDNTYF